MDKSGVPELQGAEVSLHIYNERRFLPPSSPRLMRMLYLSDHPADI
jgi:hypothetical protein